LIDTADLSIKDPTFFFTVSPDVIYYSNEEGGEYWWFTIASDVDTNITVQVVPIGKGTFVHYLSSYHNLWS